MEDFRFTTIEPLATNADTMDWFSNEHFYECLIIMQNDNNKPAL